MRLIKPSYQIIEQESGLEGIYKQIEIAARNCYKSEPVEGITPKDFVDKMIKLNHLSTLEHGTIYLKVPMSHMQGIPAEKYINNPYSRAIKVDDYWYVNSNMRVLVENDWLDDLKYLCEPTEYHEKRVTVKFTSNIHFYKDLTRHRKNSFAIESTRYCNYSGDRFNNELTFIIPKWLPELQEGEYLTPIKLPGIGYKVLFNDKPLIISEEEHMFLSALEKAELSYAYLINICKWKPQQAAEVLPQATKADVICTSFVSDWNWIFKLRTSTIALTGKPHPEMYRLMDPLYEEFKTKEYLK